MSSSPASEIGGPISSLEPGPGAFRPSQIGGPNLVLCGFMASGKTTLARLISKRTGMGLLDTDDWIERQEDRPVARIFSDLGEPYFRAVERRAVGFAALLHGSVVAAGGGVPLVPDDLWKLSLNGIVFHLRVPLEVLHERLRGSSSRPLAAGFASASDVGRLLAAREPFYVAIPHSVEAGRRPPEAIADEVLERFRALARQGRQ